MKRMKKTLALLLAALLALGLSSPAMAQEITEEPLEALAQDYAGTPQVIRHPEDAEAFFGGTFTLSVEAMIPGGAPMEYQWRLRVAYGEYEAVPGAVGASFTANIDDYLETIGESCYFECLVFNAYDRTQYAASYDGRVTAVLEILAQPQSQTVPHGAEFTLRVEAVIPQGMEIGYQWYRYLGTGVTMIEGANEAAFRCAPGDPGYPVNKDYFPAEETYFCAMFDTGYQGDSYNYYRCYSRDAVVTVEAARSISFFETIWESILASLRITGYIAAAIIIIPVPFTLGMGLILSLPFGAFMFVLMNLFTLPVAIIIGFFQGVGGLFK